MSKGPVDREKAGKGQDEAALPEGFVYLPDFLSEAEEAGLLEIIPTLDFRIFEYKGFPAKRRIVDYGWSYNFNTNQLSRGDDIPAFLLAVRARAAAAAQLEAEELEEALITEYSPGAQINWHRDLPMFEQVLGISLLQSCTFKLKPYQKEGKPLAIPLAPRSLYIMTGAARWSYLHHIPPVKELRYSITFRTLRRPAAGKQV
jgi:alkylated DNA repair dioxygenase AlkB